ncbi:NAD-dependent epimerase/dehydratase family protein [Azonexus sp.]|uniref:NAD-dependent epimerase/dehydratase family protein n=1 Tax=Azonexus sp. TaxID=1872668 RepID=UPI0039E7080F
MQKILIVGSGDVARRILCQLPRACRVYALVRDAAAAALWRAAGAVPIQGDLDQPESLARLGGLADIVLHLAPPAAQGEQDSRSRHLLSCLSRAASLPRTLIYVSTTGVYGDCGGAWIDETRPRAAQNLRAKRRVDAENALRLWGRRNGVRVSILRAPGIYAKERLPRARLEQAMPALLAEEDVYSNHIHAEDLAAACVAALRRGRPGRAYNVVDDSHLKMADYFDRVAAALDLPAPPRLARPALQKVLTPLQLSFMRESRRIHNHRLKNELRLRLRYPTVDAALAEIVGLSPRREACSS